MSCLESSEKSHLQFSNLVGKLHLHLFWTYIFFHSPSSGLPCKVRNISDDRIMCETVKQDRTRNMTIYPGDNTFLLSFCLLLWTNLPVFFHPVTSFCALSLSQECSVHIRWQVNLGRMFGIALSRNIAICDNLSRLWCFDVPWTVAW